MKRTLRLSKYNRGVISVLLIILLTVVALTFGWNLRESVLNHLQPYSRLGVSAGVPVNWQVNEGIAGDELVFSVSAPLALNHRYLVHLLPSVPGGKVTDVVVTRNLSQGQNLPFYKVESQQAVQFRGRNGYQVEYTYIKNGATGEDPAIIKGMDMYFEESGKILLVALEDEINQFDASLPGFYNFAASVTYRPEVAK